MVLRVKKPEEISETCLQIHCRQWLEKSGLWYRLLIFHVPNERQGSVGAGMHFKRMGVRPGVADWLAFPLGRPPIAVELKDTKGKQSHEQEVFQKWWEAIGNTYVIARSLDEFMAALEFC